MFKYLKQLIPYDLRQRLKRSMFAHADMYSRLANLKRAGFFPTGAIDGGAYRGDWTQVLWKIWPMTPSVMIEPNPAKFHMLNALAKMSKGSTVVAKAVGRIVGEVLFRVEDTNSRVVSGPCSNDLITVPCTTLDNILDQLSDLELNLLKLDLQGYELEALAGGERHLKQFEVIILEVSILRIGDVPLFSEVDRYLESRGYRLYDLLPQYYRPRDGALWQADAFYVRNDSLLIASRSWD